MDDLTITIAGRPGSWNRRYREFVRVMDIWSELNIKDGIDFEIIDSGEAFEAKTEATFFDAEVFTMAKLAI